VKGEVVHLFAFDISSEALLPKMHEALGSRTAWYEPQTKHASPRGVSLHRPLSVAMAPAGASLGGKPLQIDVHVYEFGAITIAMRCPFEAVALSDLAGLHEPKLEDGRTLDQVARSLCDQFCSEMAAWLERASPGPHEPEAYTIFCVHDLGVSDAETWLAAERRAVAGLLANLPPDRLSSAQIDEVFRYHRSFEKTDAIVLDWDAALVVELSGRADDVLFAIELANVQLEEFRHMDQTLDRFMNQAYDDLERRTFSRFGVSRVVLNKLRRFRIDLAKLEDEVTNITKFFGDWHLARVYLAARERFHLDRWRSSVEHRLSQLDQMYNIVRTEIMAVRSFWVEIIVVLLIALELLRSLWK
jgi:hypothetical protein